MVRAFLQYKGKYLTVRRFKGKLELCAVEKQRGSKKKRNTNEFTVDICEQANKMAFCFWYEHQQYLPKVDGDTLELEKVAVDAVDGSSANAPDIPDSSWFEKEPSGLPGSYALRTVAEPKQYIAPNRISSQWKFKLSQHPCESIVVKQKTINASK